VKSQNRVDTSVLSSLIFGESNRVLVWLKEFEGAALTAELRSGQASPPLNQQTRSSLELSRKVVVLRLWVNGPTVTIAGDHGSEKVTVFSLRHCAYGKKPARNCVRRDQAGFGGRGATLP